MKTLRLRLPTKQRGSFYTTLLTLVVFGTLATCGLKIAPAYIDNNTVRHVMEGIVTSSDIKEMSLGEIRQTLAKSLITNNIRQFDTSTVVLVKEGDHEYVEINYETRVHLISNLDAVVVHNNRFNKF
jgi:hypothetical protein